jgi:RNA-binding protein NOB1
LDTPPEREPVFENVPGEIQATPPNSSPLTVAHLPESSSQVPSSEHPSSILESGPMAQKIPGESQTNDDLTSSEDLCLPDLSELTIVDLPESSSQPAPSEFPSSTPVFLDPSSEDDGEGEWITPDNVAIHQARESFSMPDASARKAAKTIDKPLHVACMTADYAMQNVLLHMGLNIVGLHGKKITTVKSWVLRCHACFK